jgi:hypothetical protein
MKEVFADTFYFLALLSSTDAEYEKARAITANQSARLVTTTWVLTELANSLAKREQRDGFLKTYRALRANPVVVIVEPEPCIFEAGVELYVARSDKDWSLTDCISFIVMEQRNISDALTGDHHFEQAGFRTLLK